MCQREEGVVEPHFFSPLKNKNKILAWLTWANWSLTRSLEGQNKSAHLLGHGKQLRANKKF